MGRLTVVNVLNELLTLGLILWGIKTGKSLFEIILIFVFANLPGFIAIIVLSGKVIRPIFKPDLKLCSSLPEVVGDGGMLIDPDEPDALTNAIEKVLGDERLKEELSKA